MLSWIKPVGRQWKVRHAVAALKRIRRCAQYGHVMFPIRGHNIGFQQVALTGGQLHQHMGLSSVPKRIQEVRRGDQITVFVYKKGVPVKKIVIPLFGGSFVERINNGANGCGGA